MRPRFPQWLTILLCFAFSSALSSPVLAQVSGPNGKIAYVVGMPDNTTDIWVMDADGSNQPT